MNEWKGPYGKRDLKMTVIFILIILSVTALAYITEPTPAVVIIPAMFWSLLIAGYLQNRRKWASVYEHHYKVFKGRTRNDVEALEMRLDADGMAYKSRPGGPIPSKTVFKTLVIPSEDMNIVIDDLKWGLEVYVGPETAYNTSSVDRIKAIIDDAIG